jgi:hypothetical protein
VVDPVLFERVVARVDAIVEKQSDLATRLNQLATTLEDRYLPREVYRSNRDADRQDVRDLNIRLDKADANRAADKRLIITSLVAPLLVGLILAYIAIQIGGSPT